MASNISAFAIMEPGNTRWQPEQQLIDWSSQKGYFVLKYQPEDENTVNLVLEALKEPIAL